MAYCITDEVRAIGTQLSTSAVSDDALGEVVERASRFFDRLCGVADGYFEPADSATTTRVVYGDGGSYLRLPPYVAGTLSTTLGLPDGYTAPEFAERDGYLVLKASNGSLLTREVTGHTDYGWWSGVPVTVTARWGYATTPPEVKMAVIELAINLVRETDPAELSLLDLERQPLRERVPPRVDQVAKFYRVQGVVLV